MPKDVKPDDLDTRVAGDAAERVAAPEDEPDAIDSNSSNYGGSALADKPIEDRVLHDE